VNRRLGLLSFSALNDNTIDPRFARRLYVTGVVFDGTKPTLRWIQPLNSLLRFEPILNGMTPIPL
jgi:hypothetical protein